MYVIVMVLKTFQFFFLYFFIHFFFSWWENKSQSKYIQYLSTFLRIFMIQATGCTSTNQFDKAKTHNCFDHPVQSFVEIKEKFFLRGHIKPKFVPLNRTQIIRIFIRHFLKKKIECALPSFWGLSSFKAKSIRYPFW